MREKQQKPVAAKKQENPRSGHRRRLRERLEAAGPKSLADHELLELIIFRAIPRRDVKEIARALIQHFGDISAVMSAPRDELVSLQVSVIVLSMSFAPSKPPRCASASQKS